MKSKMMFLFFVFLFFQILISQENSFNPNYLIKNPIGWNIPNSNNLYPIDRVKKIKLAQEIPALIEQEYYYSYGTTINKKIFNELEIDQHETIGTYQKEKFQRLRIYKFENTQQILCYLYERLDNGNAKDSLSRERLSCNMSIPLEDGIGGTYIASFFFNHDDNGILLYCYPHYQNSNLIEILKGIYYFKLEIKKKKDSQRSKDLREFEKNWKKFLKNPIISNAKIVLTTLDNIKIEASENFTTEEYKFWTWFWKTTDVLEYESFCGENTSLKILLKLLPISMSMLSGNIDIILGKLIRINPELLLRELIKCNPIQLKVILLSHNYSCIKDYENLLKIELRERINSLKKIEINELSEIKTKCLDVLENELLSFAQENKTE